jgi:peptidoglycan/LPS O-acetylase OafA/YrhL
VRILLLALVLAVVGCVALPLSALVLDGTDTGEDLIVPVQVLLTAALGAALGSVVLDRSRPPRRRALSGAGIGVLGALAGVVVFFLLLNGLDGA